MVYRTRNGFEMSDGGTDQFEMQSKEADSKSAEDIAQTSSQGNDQLLWIYPFQMKKVFDHSKKIPKQRASRPKPKSNRKLMSTIRENHRKEAQNTFQMLKFQLKNPKSPAEKNWVKMNQFLSKLKNRKHNW